MDENYTIDETGIKLALTKSKRSHVQHPNNLVIDMICAHSLHLTLSSSFCGKDTLEP